MTWQELHDNLTPEQRETDVTIFDSTVIEYYTPFGFSFSTETDILDSGHPYLVIRT